MLLPKSLSGYTRSSELARPVAHLASSFASCNVF